MDEKDFSKWFEKKPRIHRFGPRPAAHEREIWWCYFGVNIGSEEDGKRSSASRPILIYRKFNRRTVIAIPLTTSAKQSAFHLPIDIEDDLKRFAMIQHMRSIDIKRLHDLIGRATEDSYSAIEDAVLQISKTDWHLKRSTAAF